MLGVPGSGVQLALLEEGLQLQVKAKVKTGIAAVAVFVCYQHCFVLVTVGAGQTLAPTVTKHLALLELECGVTSSPVPSRCAVSLANRTAEYPSCAARIPEEAHGR